MHKKELKLSKAQQLKRAYFDGKSQAEYLAQRSKELAEKIVELQADIVKTDARRAEVELHLPSLYRRAQAEETRERDEKQAQRKALLDKLAQLDM